MPNKSNQGLTPSEIGDFHHTRLSSLSWEAEELVTKPHRLANLGSRATLIDFNQRVVATDRIEGFLKYLIERQVAESQSADLRSN